METVYNDAVKYKYLFIIILLLSIFLRFWKLGSFPPGFTWDEAAIGYNAWGILTVHRDEWLQRTPFSFRSFGDYKSPLAIYLTAVSEKVFGPTVYAVRFPVAVASVFLVLASYFLAKELWGREEWENEVALFVMLLVAVSPWALHFSGIAFESMIAASLAAWGAIFFCKGVRKTWIMIPAGVCYALSLYAYHSAKLVVPLTILVLLYIYRDAIKILWKSFLLFFLTCFIIAAPLAYVSIYGKASDRFFGSTAILTSDKKIKPVGEVLSILSSNFISHLSPAYLFMGKENTYRQSNMKDGILSPLEGLLILIAIVSLVRTKKHRKLSVFLLMMWGISILPATLGFDVPHANRTLLGLPWIQLLAGSGFASLLDLFHKKKQLRKYRNTLLAILLVLMGIGLTWHTNNDKQVYSEKKALSDLQYGYIDAAQYARSQESSVDRVYFSNYYGQAYIYLLFVKHMNPIDFRNGGLANYVISDHPFTDAIGQKHVLIIGTPQETPDSLTYEKEFKTPQGDVVLRAIKL